MFVSHVAGYADLFAWAANPLVSEYQGKHAVAGRVCSLWNLRSKILRSINNILPMSGSLVMTGLHSVDDAPVLDFQA